MVEQRTIQETQALLAVEMDYKYKVQTASQYGCKCVAYVDSRDVQKRLDEVVGANNWQDEYKELKGVIYCGLSIRYDGDEWVTKWDCGVESFAEKEKGEASDAFKRAAVKHGIGRFLYDMELMKCPSAKNSKGKYAPAYEQNNANKIIWGNDALTEFLLNNAINKSKGIAPEQKQEAQKPALEVLTIKQINSKTWMDWIIDKKKAGKSEKQIIASISTKYKMDTNLKESIEAIYQTSG